MSLILQLSNAKLNAAAKTNSKFREVNHTEYASAAAVYQHFAQDRNVSTEKTLLLHQIKGSHRQVKCFCYH